MEKGGDESTGTSTEQSLRLYLPFHNSDQLYASDSGVLKHLGEKQSEKVISTYRHSLKRNCCGLSLLLGGCAKYIDT